MLVVVTVEIVNKRDIRRFGPLNLAAADDGNSGSNHFPGNKNRCVFLMLYFLLTNTIIQVSPGH